MPLDGVAFSLLDYNGVPSSIKFLEWGCTFSDFWGKTVLHIYD